MYRLLRIQYRLLSRSYAYTFVRTRAILPCMSIRQSMCLCTVLVRARALDPCEIGVYSYPPTALCTFEPESVPNVLHRS